MKHSKKAFIKKVVFFALSGAMILFIWYNSLQPPDASAQASGAVSDAIRSVFDALHIPLSPDAFILVYLRKIAHFLEYAVLGTLLSFLVICNYRVRLQNIINILFVGVLTAVCDETIQIYTGRGSVLTDVWIDISGVFAAVFLIFLFHRLFATRRRRA